MDVKILYLLHKKNICYKLSFILARDEHVHYSKRSEMLKNDSTSFNDMEIVLNVVIVMLYLN